MPIRFAGSVQAPSVCWCIYVIAKGHCLYIGETQLNPVIRWGQHLSANGTFSIRLHEADEQLVASKIPIHLWAFELPEMEGVAPEECKAVIRFIEHRVHELCIAKVGTLQPIETVISDTSRTAKYTCRYVWPKQTAHFIFDEISKRVGSLSPTMIPA